MCYFLHKFLYSNRKRHVNRKRGRNSKIGNYSFVRNCLTIPKPFFVFVLAPFVIEFYTFENGQRKKQEKNNKNKTKPKFEKSPGTKCFFIFLLFIKCFYYLLHQISQKSVNK